MPHTKTTQKSTKSVIDDRKILEIDPEEKEVDPELIPGEEVEDELEDEAALDDEEVNPFGDKWEE